MDIASRVRGVAAQPGAVQAGPIGPRRVRDRRHASLPGSASSRAQSELVTLRDGLCSSARDVLPYVLAAALHAPLRRAARRVSDGAAGHRRRARRRARRGRRRRALDRRLSRHGTRGPRPRVPPARSPPDADPTRRTLQPDGRPSAPPAARPAHLAHRPLQLPLHLLHAEGDLRAGVPVPAAQRGAVVRGDRAAGARLRRPRRDEDPPHRRRAAGAAQRRPAGRAPRAASTASRT